MQSMKRRQLLITTAACTALNWPSFASAQPKRQPILIGVLTTGSGSIGAGGMTVFREELAARGWIEGVQLTIEEAHAQDAYEELPMIADALAKKNPAVIVASNSVGESDRSCAVTFRMTKIENGRALYCFH